MNDDRCELNTVFPLRRRALIRLSTEACRPTAVTDILVGKFFRVFVFMTALVSFSFHCIFGKESHVNLHPQLGGEAKVEQ